MEKTKRTPVDLAIGLSSVAATGVSVLALGVSTSAARHANTLSTTVLEVDVLRHEVSVLTSILETSSEVYEFVERPESGSYSELLFFTKNKLNYYALKISVYRDYFSPEFWRTFEKLETESQEHWTMLRLFNEVEPATREEQENLLVSLTNVINFVEEVGLGEIRSRLSNVLQAMEARSESSFD